MVYWTADDYQKTGCLNYECPGFVVTSQATTPGMALPVGKITLKILIDFQIRNWNVYLNGEMVGYFPGAIVNGMDGSTQIQMEGTMYSTPGEGKSSPMGNGILAADTNAAAKFTWVVMRGSRLSTIRWPSTSIQASTMRSSLQLQKTALRDSPSCSVVLEASRSRHNFVKKKKRAM
ncbi:uncharacterized protein LOC104584211 [Brachypodium distachyon]|nr:uncharacterized protein LOC104584211 [Brachypodium distachyon]XP_024317812.1 uncharacterized protein LOC104584211 [Brachypodium distachyon]|eukprot:XP_024317811.1 uncharacterized protein LOC104584211 [Brachypodium distachyon]